VRVRLRKQFQALSVRNYRLYASGQIVSLIGGWMQITAQDWLVLSLSHNSPTALGFVTALQFAPILLLTLYGGKLADRFDKRKLLMIALSFYTVLAAIMGTLVVSGAIQLWQVFVFAGLWGTVSSLETPTRQAFVSEMVGRDLLPNALSLSSATFNSARIIGPAIGGVTIAAFGTGTAFVLNALTYAGPLIALTRMNSLELHREVITGAVSKADASIRDGLTYVRQRIDLIIPMVLMLILGLFAFNFQITLAVLAKNVFHTSAAEFGLMSTGVAVGALFGALAGGTRKRRPSSWLVIGSAIAFCALETVVGLLPTLPLTLLVLVPTGFAMIFFAQAANQRVQMGTDSAYRGRVMALYIMVFMGTTPIGAPLIGWCAEAFGPRSGIWIGGSLSLLAGLFVLGYELRRTGGRVRVSRSPIRLYVAGDREPAMASTNS
jgi:MFS family permease